MNYVYAFGKDYRVATHTYNIVHYCFGNHHTEFKINRTIVTCPNQRRYGHTNGPNFSKALRSKYHVHYLIAGRLVVFIQIRLECK